MVVASRKVGRTPNAQTTKKRDDITSRISEPCNPTCTNSVQSSATFAATFGSSQWVSMQLDGLGSRRIALKELVLRRLHLVSQLAIHSLSTQQPYDGAARRTLPR